MAGEDVAAVVECDAVPRSHSVFGSAPMNTNSALRVEPASLPGLGVLDDHRLEGVVADQLADLAMREDIDGRQARMIRSAR